MSISKKVVIFGAGWIGTQLKNFLEDLGYSVTLVHPAIRIEDRRTVGDYLDHQRSNVVINAAGKTGSPNIDWCEASLANRTATFQSNVVGPVTLAQACEARGIYMVHLSSGCVYDGPSPQSGGFTEEDTPNPNSYYAMTKVHAEQYLKAFPVLILRLRMPFAGRPHKRNLISKLARYKKIIDVPNSLTNVRDLFIAMIKLMSDHRTGIYNVVNQGAMGHAEIMEFYRQYVNPGHQYEVIPLEELGDSGLVKTGRSNCVLNGDKLMREGIATMPVRDAMELAMYAYGNAMGQRVEIP